MKVISKRVSLVQWLLLSFVSPDGQKRAIFFSMGKPLGADTSEANGYPEFSTNRENDLHLIRIGMERYEIPDAVILGG